MEKSHEVLASDLIGVGRNVEEITTFRIDEKVSVVVGRKHKSTTVITEDEPDRIKHSLWKVTWATVPVSFVPPLPDTVRRPTPPPPPPPPANAACYTIIKIFSKILEGSVDCGHQQRSDRKGKGFANARTTEPARLDETSISDVVVVPLLITPLSDDDILARAAAAKISLKDYVGAEWVFSFLTTFLLYFLSNVHTTAKAMSLFKRRMSWRRRGKLWRSELQL
ncbi:hypothetical protein ACOSQ2_024256 [Xanthoceras sorbifolium]